jgi:hypothetical protein
MLYRRGTRAVAAAGTVVALAMGVLLGCGGSDEPAPGGSSTTTSPSSSASPSVRTPTPTLQNPLQQPSVVIVREVPGGERMLVAYDLTDGTTDELVTLSRDEDPTVSPDGTQVVLVRANGPWRDPVTNAWQSKSGSHLVLIDLVDGSERMVTPRSYRTKRLSPQWNGEDGWVYYLEQAGRDPIWLMRVNPETGETERVPSGRGITGFTLMPDERYAWVRATLLRKMTIKGACEAWRLDLTTGQVNLHRAHVCEADSLVWSASGDRLAFTGTLFDEGSLLYVAPWPGSWRRPQQQSGPPASRRLYEGPGRPGSSGNFFGSVGWTQDDRAVVLASRHATWGPSGTSPTFDRWYVSLIDRRTGVRTDITPSGIADTSFGVWWSGP